MEMWTYFLKEADGVKIAEDVVIEDLADCYDISYGVIRNTCGHVKAAAGVRRLDRVNREMILESLRQMNRVDFSGLAQFMPSAYTWDDITITDDQRNVLKTACDRCRLRNRIGRGWGLIRKNSYGNGVSLLLYGPPGTGKTMAAQVVASELGMPLYRVDISQIFSKYIGETEKNLSVVFDAAKGSNVILFFDEADALFSRRTEINNSNDKYANSETAYLLQKIEEYDGMSILATNLYTNFDTAFVRRITYAVRLDSPDEEARYILWSTMLPETARMEEDLPFRFLAKKFELAGSNIRAILQSAAYMAGAEGKAIGMAHIVRAMEYEFRKLGRFIDREAFGPYAVYLSMPGKDPENEGV
jgi:SpoVK/Ycf46/Vps4 family AAA+-type ATPase